MSFENRATNLVEHQPEAGFDREQYLNSQLMLLTMSVRFGLWLMTDLNGLRYQSEYGEKYVEKLGLRQKGKEFGDYMHELAMLYAGYLSGSEPVDHTVEYLVWSGRTLGANPLNNIYQAWEEHVGRVRQMSLAQRLNDKMRSNEWQLKDKGQFFNSLEEWLIYPWRLDRTSFALNQLTKFEQEHWLHGEGVHPYPYEDRAQIRQLLKPHLKRLFPKGAVVFANLVSAIPDTALVAYWIEHAKRQRKQILLSAYQYSPNVLAICHAWLPDWEMMFLEEAVARGLPVLAVDGFASSGGTIVNALETFPPKIGTIATAKNLPSVPFYFLLTTAYTGKELVPRVLSACDGAVALTVKRSENFGSIFFTKGNMF